MRRLIMQAQCLPSFHFSNGVLTLHHITVLPFPLETERHQQRNTFGSLGKPSLVNCIDSRRKRTCVMQHGVIGAPAGR